MLPFGGALAAAWLAPTFWQLLAIQAFLAYGALILSFLGGVHWGLALAHGQRHRLVAGILPSLVAWPSLLIDARLGAWILLVGFLALRAYEAGPGAPGLPAWYRRLRTRLTLVVAACHLGVIARLLLLV
ncbi:hypothetical protein BEI_0743 [Halomonas beimenensis]|uniref:DUF3429 domain-containing protein n=1 Tax=Halomonas beimenensis TaxID=475662 RepID=A0A291P4D1_9GAMM|nr:hypothetical protein BEI_0743 [Halomonas beimenensis]